MAFVPGYSQGATFQLDGAGGATTLKIKSWSWAEHVERLITTHTSSAGVQACLAGILDGDGNVTACIDAAALPNAAAPGIVAGAKGTITFAVGASTPWSIHVMVTKNHHQSNVNGLVEFDVDVALDSTSGSYIRPT